MSTERRWHRRCTSNMPTPWAGSQRSQLGRSDVAHPTTLLLLSLAIPLGLAPACSGPPRSATSNGAVESSGTPPSLTGSPVPDAGAAGSMSAADASSVDDGGDAFTPFESDPPAVYVAKVKNVLVGLPPTDA